MPPRSALGLAAERARLYHEASRLTERFRERLGREGDAGGGELERRREVILERIEALGALPAADPAEADAVARADDDSAAAIQRIIELNRELLAVLEAEKARVRRQLTEIGRGRRSLESYQGPAPLSPAFCDRLG